MAARKKKRRRRRKPRVDGDRLEHKYALDVVAGKIPAGKIHRQACERHIKDLETAADRGLYYDTEAADHVFQFFMRYLRHWEGSYSGQAFELQPWQFFTLGVPFGWKREATGLRRFTHSYEELPRKQGKTAKAAGTATYLLVADGEPGAQVYAVGTKRDQARIVLNAAGQMVLRSPALRSRLEVLRHNIAFVPAASKFETLGSDSDTLDGLNVHGAIFDELHAYKDRHLYDVVDTATGARDQPMLAMITTAGLYNREGIGWKQHEYAQKVLDGVLEDDSFFGFIASTDPKDDWTKPKAWKKANPGWGVTVFEDRVRKAYTKAIGTGAENTFRRYYLNHWVNTDAKWLDMEKWRSCGGPLDLEKLRGRPCFGGIDLARMHDLSALALFFPEHNGDRPAVVMSYWIPETDIVDRSRRDRVPYLDWKEAGLITATDGSTTDFRVIERDLAELTKIFKPQEVAFDPRFADQIVQNLSDAGITMVEHSQSPAALALPTEELGRLVLSGELRHGDDPVLGWMASNVVVRTNADGLRKPDKAKSTERIDGIYALVMAIGAHIRSREEPGVQPARFHFFDLDADA